MTNKEIKERWDNYRKANTDKPLVRNRELKEVFNLLNPKDGEIILEVGTGNGYLTLPIAQAVGGGRVVTADVSQDNLKSVTNQNVKNNLPVETFLFNDKDLFTTFPESYFDAVATIATLHHFDNRLNQTGENGRISVLKEFYRLLKIGGRLVVADVAHGTISQKYFDAIDNPKHCFPTGHPHDFFSIVRLNEILGEIGFKNINIEIKRVPWQFESREDAENFVHTIHNAKCLPYESFELAEKYLSFVKNNNYYELGWELFFVIAEKKE